jgi:hypothetical protein
VWTVGAIASFQRKSIQAVIEANNVLLMVVDIDKELIVQWKN